jgi:hypothetical protein
VGTGILVPFASVAYLSGHQGIWVQWGCRYWLFPLALLTYVCKVACPQFGLREFFDVKLPFLVLIQPVEFCFHELHPLWL